MRNVVYAVMWCLVALWMPSRLVAQTDTPAATADDSARAGDGVDSTEYVKAFDMVSNGEPEDGHALVDSLLQATKEGTPQYAEGLYWRARLASMGPGAERDYRRIIVEYPFNRRAPDALLRLGQLELGRGDRDLATQHFQRIILEYPNTPGYAAANYWLARAYFAGNKLERACAANAEALVKVGASDIELKNQIDFQNQQCVGISLTPPDSDSVATAANTTKSGKPAKPSHTASKKTTPAKGAAGKAVAGAKGATKTAKPEKAEKPAKPVNVDDESSDTVAADGAEHVASADTTTAPNAEASDESASARHDENADAETTGKAAPKSKTSAKTVPVKATTPPARGKTVYMVQVAAYQTRSQADALVVSLKKQGYVAHIDGKVAPYRVRLGHFATRQEAVSLLAKLKAKQIDGFVTEG